MSKEKRVFGSLNSRKIKLGIVTTVTALVIVAVIVVLNQPQPGMTFILYGRVAPVLGITINSKLEVLEIESDSIAQKTGFQRGDVLIEIDGVTLTSAKQAKDLIAQKLRELGRVAGVTPDEAAAISVPQNVIPDIAVTIKRNAQELTLRVKPQKMFSPLAVVNNKQLLATATPVPSEETYI